MRFVSVSGYQRDFSPLPASPFFNNPEPGAINPPWLIRLRRIVAQIRSRLLFGGRFKAANTAFREGLNLLIRLQSQSHSPFKMPSHTEATAGSRSVITTLFARSSFRAVRETIPPPAKGSAKISTLRRSHLRIVGRSHVFPPG